MAGMQRFVTYIYAYDDGQKGGNAGYAKIETRGNTGRVEIHLSGTSVIKGSGEVSFLKGQKQKFVRFPVGEFSIENGAGVFQTVFLTGNVLESGLEFDQFEGIYLKDSHERVYLSFWKDVRQTIFKAELFVSIEEWKEGLESSKMRELQEAQRQNTRNLEETQAIPKEKQKEAAAMQTKKAGEAKKEDLEAVQILNLSAVQNVQIPKMQMMRSEPAEAEMEKEQEDLFGAEDSQKAVQEAQLEEAEQEMLHTMEVPVRNVFPQYHLEAIWQNMQKNRLSVQINETVSAVQIELKDLRELPSRYWYLGNNSFLLHGFFNYHYLLFGKLQEGSWFLGVPGVYQKQERVMASIFGFPGFLSAGEAEDALTFAGQNLRAAEESTRELQPGAWYHVLEDTL